VIPTDRRPRGACREVDARVMFPGPGNDATEALNVCARCPVTEECRAYWRSIGGPRHGVWFGSNFDADARGSHPERLCPECDQPYVAYGNQKRCQPCSRRPSRGQMALGVG
jgi:hypothetical protein